MDTIGRKNRNARKNSRKPEGHKVIDGDAAWKGEAGKIIT